MTEWTELNLHDVQVFFLGPLDPPILKFSLLSGNSENKLGWNYQNWSRKVQADEAYTLQSYSKKVAESNLNISELADFFIRVKMSY